MDPRLSKPKNKDYADKFTQSMLGTRLVPQKFVHVQDEFSDRFKEELERNGWGDGVCPRHNEPLEVDVEYDDHPGEEYLHTATTTIYCPICKNQGEVNR